VIKFVSDLGAGRWFSPGIPVSSTNKTDCHDIAEILLKVALNTKTPFHVAYSVLSFDEIIYKTFVSSS
jgi:hypothetical protein